jgi:hypothetical protein
MNVIKILINQYEFESNILPIVLSCAIDLLVRFEDIKAYHILCEHNIISFVMTYLLHKLGFTLNDILKEQDLSLWVILFQSMTIFGKVRFLEVVGVLPSSLGFFHC